MHIELRDANLDGSIDLLLVAKDLVHLLLSTPYSRGVSGCSAPGARRWWREVWNGVEPLESIADVQSAKFVDMDEDGTLDVMVQWQPSRVPDSCSLCRIISIVTLFFTKAIRRTARFSTPN
ncbi:hypothetical protein EI94DRAFT_1706550 [Lactarius quietus]|nr:hypothetical protein EI94DRAFT_1706550 [Lactarius quietus]